MEGSWLRWALNVGLARSYTMQWKLRRNCEVLIYKSILRVVLVKLYIFSVILQFLNETWTPRTRKLIIVLFIPNLSNCIAVDILFSSFTSGKKASCNGMARMLVDIRAIMDRGVSKFPSLLEIEPQATSYYRTSKIF